MNLEDVKWLESQLKAARQLRIAMGAAMDKYWASVRLAKLAFREEQDAALREYHRSPRQMTSARDKHEG